MAFSAGSFILSCVSDVPVFAQLFRKEAIYRRMRYYARESERYQEEVDGLNRRRATCEAGIAAIEACWNQVGFMAFHSSCLGCNIIFFY